MTDTNSLNPEALATMLAMVGGDNAFLAEMIDTYLADSPQQLAEIEQALAANDAPRLRRAAHSLKSNSDNFGATNLADLARKLEALGKQGSLDGAAALLAEAQAEYERVAVALLAVRG
jgi:two-component system, sensor histidine kinase and response regulator